MKKYTYSLIPNSVMLDTINTMNITKRESEFESLFEDLIGKVSQTITLDQVKQHRNTTQCFKNILD